MLDGLEMIALKVLFCSIDLRFQELQFQNLTDFLKLQKYAISIVVLMEDALVSRAFVTSDGQESSAHRSYAMHGVVITASARTGHVFVYLDGTVVTALWKAVHVVALVMVNAASPTTVTGNANVSTVGMDRIARH